MRNQIVLSAVVSEISPLRYTPGGVAAIEMVVTHESEQTDGASKVKIVLKLKALAMSEIAEALEQLVKKNILLIGTAIDLNGFLASPPKSTFPTLHITAFRLVP
jgi:primosomal replication protein N